MKNRRDWLDRVGPEITDRLIEAGTPGQGDLRRGSDDMGHTATRQTGQRYQRQGSTQEGSTQAKIRREKRAYLNGLLRKRLARLNEARYHSAFTPDNDDGRAML